MKEPTPGPWIAEKSGTASFNPPRMVIRSPEHGTIAVCSFPDAGDDEANALMLAAAPIMYAALKEAWWILEDEAHEDRMYGEPSEPLHDAINAVKSALNKADGGMS